MTSVSDMINKEDDAEGKPLDFPSTTIQADKLKEVLRNLCLAEPKIVMDASKDFIGLLEGESGGEALCYYVKASPQCTELCEAWKLQKETRGLPRVWSLIATILEHPAGREAFTDFQGIRGRGLVIDSSHKSRHYVSKSLERFARSIVDNNLDDVYAALNSAESTRQKSALLLMAAVVRRSSNLAFEVIRKFDFSHKGFKKLVDLNPRKVGSKSKREQQRKAGTSSRRAFIDFAMSFLEASSPRVLRWVLQKREIYGGVLQGLSKDNEETIVSVLQTLQNKVLSPQSLVPPSLQSVLFGDATLEQLSIISGNPTHSDATEFAHKILMMICSDPAHGLVPEFDGAVKGQTLSSGSHSMKGNPPRLIRLMLKLKAAEVANHKELLLTMIQGKPSLGAAYMESFPYNLEPRAAAYWFSAVSLASDVVSTTNAGTIYSSSTLLQSRACSLDTTEMRTILKCILPSSFYRAVINRGLLHCNFLVRHGSLKILLEALRSMNGIINGIDVTINSIVGKKNVINSSCWVSNEGETAGSIAKPVNFHGADSLRDVGSFLSTTSFTNKKKDESLLLKLSFLKQGFQDEFRAMVPDPQVLLKLLSLINMVNSDASTAVESQGNLKFSLQSKNGMKNCQSDIMGEDGDIFINKIEGEVRVPQSADPGAEDDVSINEGFSGELKIDNVIALFSDVTLFHCKLLEVLTLYMRILPDSLFEGSYDFFKILPSDPMLLSTCQLQALLSLLLEYIKQCSLSRTSTKNQELIYKHLQPLVKLMLHSPTKDLRSQACVLARKAMMSTGAFDANLLEIEAWFMSFPGYFSDSTKKMESAVFENMTGAVTRFLCDAVSTVGNNLHKSLTQLQNILSGLTNTGDISPDFGPLVICILQKCIQALESDKKVFKLTELCMISAYVRNSLKFLLQIQVDAGLLSSLIISLLSAKLERQLALTVNSDELACEWRPLRSLFYFAKHMKKQEVFILKSFSNNPENAYAGSLSEVVSAALEMIREGHDGLQVAASLSSSLVCAEQTDVVHSFLSVIVLFQQFFKDGFELLSSVFLMEHDLLCQVANLWPDIFCSSLAMLVPITIISEEKAREVLPGHKLNGSFSSTLVSSGMSHESAAHALCMFLQRAPFHMLLPATLCFNDSNMLSHAEILNLLKVKVSEASSSALIILLRFILFWIHQIELYGRAAPSCCMEKQICLCFSLFEHALFHTLQSVMADDTSESGQSATSALFIEEVVHTIFLHPSMKMFLLSPAYVNKKQNEYAKSFQDCLFASKQYVTPIGNCVMYLLKNIADYLSVEQGSSKWKLLPVKIACRNLLLHLISAFKEDFECFVLVNENQIPCSPSFYALSVLIRYISPFVLLELIDWLFYGIGRNHMATLKGFSHMSIGIYFAEAAFEMLPCYLACERKKDPTCDLFWEASEESFDANLLEKIYCRLLDLFMNHPLEGVETCLLQAVRAAKFINWTSQPSVVHFPLSMAMLRAVNASPMEVVVRCIQKTNMVKSKLLLLITEMSPAHSECFGKIFLSIISKGVSEVDNLNHDSMNHITEIMKEYYHSGYDGYMLMLPTVLVYLLSDLNSEHVGTILKFYSKVLLDGFSNWQNFVTGNTIFLLNTSEVFTSTDELVSFFTSSILGKAIHMLHHYTNGNPGSTKQRNAVFNSICDSSAALDEFLCKIDEISSCSYEKLLNLVNNSVAKISLLRLLLCPHKHSTDVPMTKEDAESSGVLPEGRFTSEEKLKPKAYFRLISSLVSNLDKIVQSYSLSSLHSKSSNDVERPLLLRYLEVIILTTVVELSEELGNNRKSSKYLAFLEPFVRSSLLYRFEDPITLRVVRTTLLWYSSCHFNFSNVLKHLLAHSLFVPTILWIDANNVASLDSHDADAVSIRPPSSVLQHLQIQEHEKTFLDGMNVKSDIFETVYDMRQIKLEIVRLLRALVALTTQNTCAGDSQDVSFSSGDLLSLLLSGYGATTNETDMEVCHLMHEIEFMKGSYYNYIAGMDFLWGTSASKIRTEQTLDRLLASDNVGDIEMDEHRRRRFLENLSVDRRLSLMTILNFPYSRMAMTQPATVEKLLQGSMADIFSTSSVKREVASYDPDFILRFSIHGLSRGFFDAIEFARLGLLAIAFVSMSSPDEGMRKLGYDSIGKFKKLLEGNNRGKTFLHLQLLLTYLQNGITEPWQKIPSVVAVFAAEASLILIEPSQLQYMTISQLITDASGVNLEAVPLFHKLFGSCDTQCQSNRGWMLRLLYVGLNLDDDALIFRRNFLLEFLLGFHASSLATYESRCFVLQLMKKAVKLPILRQHLVKNCGLISWLSSILASCTLKLYEEQGAVYSEIESILEVVIETLTCRRITLWLQETAFEQLCEFSSFIHSLFVHGLDFLREHARLVNLSLWTMTLTLKISMKRKIYKPHFSLSFEGIYHIYVVIDEAFSIGSNRLTAELGLKCILMNPPPQRVHSKEKFKLLKLVMWCFSTAMHMQTKSKKTTKRNVSPGLQYQDPQSEDALVGKLLRWVVALVIRGKILGSISMENLTGETLESLLDKVTKSANFNVLDADSDTLLAVLILCLQQHQGNLCDGPTLISVVSALRLLLPCDSKYSADDKLNKWISALSSRVPCPVEANRFWRWSYYQPWKDLAADSNVEQQPIDVQSCRSLLLAFSKVLSEKAPDFSTLSSKLPLKSRPITQGNTI